MRDLLKYPNYGVQLLIVTCRFSFKNIWSYKHHEAQMLFVLTNKVYNYLMSFAYFEITRIL